MPPARCVGRRGYAGGVLSLRSPVSRYALGILISTPITWPPLDRIWGVIRAGYAAHWSTPRRVTIDRRRPTPIPRLTLPLTLSVDRALLLAYRAAQQPVGATSPAGLDAALTASATPSASSTATPSLPSPTAALDAALRAHLAAAGYPVPAPLLAPPAYASDRRVRPSQGALAPLSADEIAFIKNT